ncbi:MAG TPA: TlpA disulfide reductase family protein [Chitinophagaceae bacterium]
MPGPLLYLFLLFQLFSIYINAQPQHEGFTLAGKITGGDNKVIYLSYYDEENQSAKTDSSLIKDGAFLFSGKLKNPAVAFISLRKREAIGSNATDIIIEPGNMHIDLVFNKFTDAYMTGSRLQDDYELLRLKGNKITANHPLLFDSNGYIYKDLHDSLAGKLKRVNDTINRIDYAYFDEHPGSYLTAYLLQYQARNLSADSLALFYNRLSDHLKNHVVTQTIRSRLKGMKVGTVGTMAAKFIAKDTSGHDFYSGLIKEKYILLDFWASWCVPCREQSPFLIGLHKKYTDKGLRIVSIADDRDLAKWKEAIEKDKTNLWTHVRREVNVALKSKGMADEKDVNDRFNISTLPTYILIDPYGVIIGRFQENPAALENLLSSIFK